MAIFRCSVYLPLRMTTRHISAKQD